MVAATNVDLQKAVDQGRFRADLYYRLNIFPVLIPPLRNRQEDIPLLVDRFLDKYTARHGKRVSGVTDAALAELAKYQWPGNIRELENMIERGVIIAGPGEQIDVRHLFPCLSMNEGTALPGQPELGKPQGSEGIPDLVEQALDSATSLDQIETLMLEKAVARAKGNLSSAARLLGVTRPQLAYRLKKRQQDSEQ